MKQGFLSIEKIILNVGPLIRLNIDKKKWKDERQRLSTK